MFYNNNNINRLEEKIINLEKIVSSISPKDYSAEIKNFNNANQIQDNQIKKNASKIDEISITNNNLQSLINEIERDSSNNLSTQVQNIDASKINSIYSLLYLMNIKNDLQFSNPDLNEFNYSIPKKAVDSFDINYWMDVYIKNLNLVFYSFKPRNYECYVVLTTNLN